MINKLKALTMRFAVQKGLVAMLLAGHAAAGASEASTRMPMAVDRSIALSLMNNAISKKCPVCSNPLVDVDEREPGEHDSDYSHLIVCPHSSKHVFHTSCLIRIFAGDIKCSSCFKSCAEYFRQALLSENPGNQVFRKSLLTALAQQPKNILKNIFRLLRLFPAEFDAIRLDFCKLGSSSVVAIGTLDEVWHMELGIPSLERYFLDNDMDTPHLYAFYYSLRKFINCDRPTILMAKTLINTIPIVYRSNNEARKKCIYAIVDTVTRSLKCDLCDDGIYYLLQILVENGNIRPIMDFIYIDRFIRNTSTEKILALIECMGRDRPLNYDLFLAIWIMVGTGRSFTPDDQCAIIKCIGDLQNRVAGDNVADTIANMKAVAETSMKGHAQARAEPMNFKDGDSMDVVIREIARSRATGLLATATKEDFTELFYKMLATKCSIGILKEVYYLMPDALRSNEIGMAIMRRCFHERRLDDAVHFIYFLPQQRCLCVKDIIELCELIKNVQGYNIGFICANLTISSLRKIMQCLEESESDRVLLYEYFQSIEFYWGIALLGNYFQRLKGYEYIIRDHRDSIITFSSFGLDHSCRKVPRLHPESPLLQILSKNISLFLEKTISNFSGNRQYIFENPEYSISHAHISILSSSFFKNSVSPADVAAFCSKQFIGLNSRSIQNICIFFSIVSDEEQEYAMKKCIYLKLLSYVPKDDVIRSLVGIGFNFTETADNKWEYKIRNGRKRACANLSIIDTTVRAMIMKADKYQLLALLREKVV